MDSVEELANQLTMRQLMLAVAESCTGGHLSNTLTDMPGSSSFFRGGVVAYSDIVKIEVVGVTADCIRNHGAVSKRTALAMADGVREALSADVGVAITGIAGPSGGNYAKPVGLVYIAVSDTDYQLSREYHFDGERGEIKRAATEAATELAIEFLEENRSN